MYPGQGQPAQGHELLSRSCTHFKITRSFQGHTTGSRSPSPRSHTAVRVLSISRSPGLRRQIAVKVARPFQVNPLVSRSPAHVKVTRSFQGQPLMSRSPALRSFQGHASIWCTMRMWILRLSLLVNWRPQWGQLTGWRPSCRICSWRRRFGWRLNTMPQ